ncbi:hypothetical protein DEU56DRAFT_756696 [Suillus clintonianus]|uniref:uncharacterized protein n=1 Tax=Suillus clintonianus TaxID=1904413 RepID=UPI001B877C2A|nr:uncharacterized protein DEU56DRAFT_756696 [Suillus clintonianus]KAG2135316.1 hypothetical protein DEU56DRAFT_756696 [Suillus clintonianus]
MPCTLPRHKTSAARGIRFNPYTRPYTSSNESIAPITAPITRTYALYIDEMALNTALERMGSAMLIDEPHALDGTMGSQQDVPIQNIHLADDEFSKMRSTLLAANFTATGANHVSPCMGRLSPNQRKLVRSLEKVVNRCIDRNCEEDHPTTDLLRERIYAALEGAVLGIEDDVMRRHVAKAENSKTNDDGHVRRSFGVPVISNNEIHQKLPTNNVIPPAARYIFDGMKRGLFSLGTVLGALRSEQFQNHRK